MLEAGGVSLVLGGHSHYYQRSCLLDSRPVGPVRQGRGGRKSDLPGFNDMLATRRVGVGKFSPGVERAILHMRANQHL